MQPSNQTAAAAAAAAVAAAKKKKKKGKAKKNDDALDALGMSPTSNNHTFSATAQAQADLIATASDLYRRIEADPQGIPDDDAYWTSLPAHLRTFIRNALPIGQLPTAAQGNLNDPNARQASTQAMIAVAQQLAQAAHASQRHLQQHPPSSNNHTGVNTNAYPPFPFDPSIFADLALHADQPLPLHPHPNSTPNSINGNSYGYSNHSNPPPTQPPGEPLPAPNAPVVLVNEYDDEVGEFEEDYYSDEELDAHEFDHHHHHHHHHAHHHGGMDVDSRDSNIHGEMNGSLGASDHAEVTPSSKKNKKKKKKKGSGATTGNTDTTTITTTNAKSPTQNDSAPLVSRPPPPSNPSPLSRMPNAPMSAPTQNYPSNNVNARNPTAARQAAAAAAVNQPPPPPSSRAAGKQPMTFNANAGKAPASTNTRSTANGVGHGVGKRAASAATSSHGHGSVNGQHGVDGRAWSSSNAQERERIKEYWLRLNEKERRSLIREEKDSVLKRTREQQRHGCHCAICQRKRRSIEDELDALYDTYYHELDAYASHLRKHTESNGQVPPPPGPGPFPGSVALDNQGAVIGGNALTKASAKRGQLQAPLNKRNPLPPEDDDGYDDEELEEDEYDDEYEYEDEEEEEDELDDPDLGKGGRRRGDRTNARQTGDFFSFGSSLTVKGILTVADDLLRNDGRKFLEMMEQLADRRAHSSHHIEDHGSEDGMDGTDVDAEEDDDLDDDPLTDEQRMEEGRRMFQIFAARMFETRVSQAYLERVAQERQLQLLRELEEEDQAEKDKEAKKAKENQKKKDKKRQAKQQKEEERMRLENEKAAEEAAVREKQEKQREAELKKQEEIRQKREAERKAKEEERLRKEEEKRKRQEEERAKELEKERKKREKEEKIRSEREAKEREQQKIKEQAENAARQKKEAEERERKAAAAAAAAAEEEKKAALRASVPVSPSSGKNQVIPRSPASAIQNGTSPNAPQRSRVSSSTSAGAATAGSGRNTRSSSAAANSTIHPTSAQPNIALGNPPSSLPAPPQGLPPRPSTSIVSQPSTLPASLPRPPVQSSGQQQNQHVVSNTNNGAQSIPSKLNAPSSSNGTVMSTSSTIAGGNSISSATPSPGVPHSSAAFQSAGLASGHGDVQQSGNGVTLSPISAAKASQPLAAQSGSRFGATFGTSNMRSPTGTSNGNDFLPTFGNKHVELGSPTNLNAAASAMGSLNLGPSPPTTANTILQQQPQHSLHQPIGPIGGVLGGNSNHSRAASQDDYNKLSMMNVNQSSTASNLPRPISRPAPGPIGPIGRPRDLIHEDHVNGLGGSMLPEGILGSSALGGDDELVEPQPRRISHNAPIAASPASSFFGGVGSSTGGASIGSRSAYGSMNSPWGSSFGPISTAGNSANNGNIGAPGGPSGSAIGSGGRLASGSVPGTGNLGGLTSPVGLASPTGLSGNPGSSSFGNAMGNIQQMQQNGIGGSNNHANPMGNAPGSGSAIDPWSRAVPSNTNNAGWDRARYAFEQPSAAIGQHSSSSMGLLHQHHNSQHGINLASLSHQQSILGGGGSGGMNLGNMHSSGPMSPFGNQGMHSQQMPIRNVFGAPGSALPHGSDRNGL